MGIALWRERVDEPETTSQPTTEDAVAPKNPAAQPVQTATDTLSPPKAVEPPTREIRHYPLDDWEQLGAAIEACHNCPLGDSCTRKVPGKGNRQADLMIIGEAPGAQEDRQGLPFVGRAGQLLDRMLRAIDLSTEQVYITNILKCRPPNNRDPQPTEVAACQPFLQAQIRLLQPKVILSVGRVSAQNLLGQQTALGRLRQQQHRLPGSDIPMLVTYHPAYLLRNPADKYKSWQDLRHLQQLITNQA